MVLVDMACVRVDLYDVHVAMCVVSSIVEACRNVLLGMWCMCIDCYDVTGCVRSWMRRVAAGWTSGGTCESVVAERCANRIGRVCGMWARVWDAWMGRAMRVWS